MRGYILGSIAQKINGWGLDEGWESIRLSLPGG